ncbi:NAD(P)H-dependent oxidoreductase [Thalassobaculum sp.]|uniref:NADPH-dependent FMN reductase n=1 Tax=Thalassobaculum sp. TaxID=2022740 RepID=UPI0032ECF0CB
MPKLLFIPGSLRAASSARATVRTLAAAIATEAEVTVAEIGTLPHYNADLKDDPTVAAFIRQVGDADGVVLVTPEYNYSVPGVLKNAIDWASRPAFASVFKDKPCLVVSVSGGALGGVRAQGHLKYVLNGMLARVHPSREIVVPSANDKVRDGKLEDEAIVGFALQTLREFMAGL